MNGYLLDTSTCVALFRGNREVEQRLSAINPETCYISDVVVAELKFGAYKSERTEENLQHIYDFLEVIKVIPFADCIDTFCKERVRLQKVGTPLEDFDLLIGCAAKAKGLVMVTHNIKHFERIEGIVIEDWVATK